MSAWYKVDEDAVTLFIYAKPNARKNEITGFFGDPIRLAIKINSPPVDGQANLELVKYLSKILDIPKKNITLASGSTSKFKNVILSGQKSDIIDQILLIISNV